MTHSNDTTLAQVAEIDQLSEKQATFLMLAAIAAVLAILGVLFFLAQVINPNKIGDDLAAAASEQQIVQRLRPVAGFEMGATSSGPKTGEQVYNGLCTACHAAGVAGAPKFGDTAAWGPRNGQGFDTLLKHAIAGFTGKTGVMPAKGGGTNSDLEIARAVVYMANKGGASFPEPKDPAAAPTDAAKKP